MGWEDGKSPPDFEARLTFISSSAGGRSGPVRGRDGHYRPIVDFGQGDLKGCICEFVGRDWVEPGESVDARVWFIFPELDLRLAVGQTFHLPEARRAADGRISKVLNEPALEGR